MVGIGSGSTMSHVLEHLVKRSHELSIRVQCIPTSLQSKQLIYDYQMPITELDCNPHIDVTIDGADEVDRNLVAIKGGGACLAQEKVVASAADSFIVVADYRKMSERLGQYWTKGIPIEVLPMAHNVIKHHISSEFKVNLSDIALRIGKEKAGPVLTDNGNLILDWKYPYEQARDYTSEQWISLSNKIKLIPGVVETGIFGNMIEKAYFGLVDGGVEVKVAQ